MISQISVGDEGAVLVYLAAGIGHQPRGAGAPDACPIITTGSMAGGRVVDESPTATALTLARSTGTV